MHIRERVWELFISFSLPLALSHLLLKTKIYEKGAREERERVNKVSASTMSAHTYFCASASLSPLLLHIGKIGWWKGSLGASLRQPKTSGVPQYIRTSSSLLPNSLCFSPFALCRVHILIESRLHCGLCIETYRIETTTTTTTRRSASAVHTRTRRRFSVDNSFRFELSILLPWFNHPRSHKRPTLQSCPAQVSGAQHQRKPLFSRGRQVFNFGGNI